MNKIHTKILAQLLLAISLFTATASRIQAQGIRNPVTGAFGGNEANGVQAAQSGGVFMGFFLIMWNTASSIGALLVLLYFVWGAFDWITSAGDKGKIEAARNKMLNAFIGLLLLVTSYTIIGFVSNLLFGTNFSVLRPTFFLNN